MMTDLRELRERIAKLDGPLLEQSDRSEICDAWFPNHSDGRQWECWLFLDAALRPSLEAIGGALGLVERVLPGAIFTVSNMREGVLGGYARLNAASSPILSFHDIGGEFVPTPECRATPPLAILLALLDALITPSDQGEEK